MKEIGKVTKFFDKIMVAVIILTKDVLKGDEIIIKGNNTEVKQKIESMEIDRQKITSAKKGEEIAIKVNQKVNNNDIVYKLD